MPLCIPARLSAIGGGRPPCGCSWPSAPTDGLEEAERSYSRVVELAPHHHQARLQLSLVMQGLGRAEDALDTLHHDEQS